MLSKASLFRALGFVGCGVVVPEKLDRHQRAAACVAPTSIHHFQAPSTHAPEGLSGTRTAPLVQGVKRSGLGQDRVDVGLEATQDVSSKSNKIIIVVLNLHMGELASSHCRCSGQVWLVIAQQSLSRVPRRRGAWRDSCSTRPQRWDEHWHRRDRQGRSCVQSFLL